MLNSSVGGGSGSGFGISGSILSCASSARNLCCLAYVIHVMGSSAATKVSVSDVVFPVLQYSVVITP